MLFIPHQPFGMRMRIKNFDGKMLISFRTESKISGADSSRNDLSDAERTQTCSL